MRLFRRLWSWWGLWNDDDEEKAMVMEVLGTCAFGCLVANSFTSDIVECPSVSNFSWKYTIFRQISESRYKDWFLGWGDGCCREPLEGEEVEGTKYECNVLVLEEAPLIHKAQDPK